MAPAPPLAAAAATEVMESASLFWKAMAEGRTDVLARSQIERASTAMRCTYFIVRTS